MVINFFFHGGAWFLTNFENIIVKCYYLNNIFSNIFNLISFSNVFLVEFALSSHAVYSSVADLIKSDLAGRRSQLRRDDIGYVTLDDQATAKFYC